MKNRMRGSWRERQKRSPAMPPNDKRQAIVQREEAIIVHEKMIDTDKNEKIWSQFVALAADISKRWEGASAVDEIKAQRGGDDSDYNS
jgi:hypothetical protein